MPLKTTGVLFLYFYLNWYHFFFIYIKKKQMRIMPVPNIVRQLLLIFCYIFSFFIFQKIK
ncbi:hypothetical protein BY996DRAFT_6748350 [Phakopsora pachyrhizi]|nr:hypothetical protein BY996DRAFT_6748350 [Phakopsora pachyrhizi]